jgi:hypothetical protein
LEEKQMNKRSITGFCLILAAALLLSACSLTSTSTTSGVLFSDDFSSTRSGWDRSVVDEGYTDYSDGTYTIGVTAAQYDLWANPGQNFTDVSVEVDATLVSGTEVNDFGMLCRYVDADNFYYAEATSDGYYAIGKNIGGTPQTITDGFPATDLVNAGNTSNHLRFDCVGSTLSLYINGTLAESVTDSDLSSGDVGLIAGTFETGGVEIAFDNFVVNQP